MHSNRFWYISCVHPPPTKNQRTAEELRPLPRPSSRTHSRKNMSVRRPPKNFRDLNSSKFLRERFLAWRARAQTTSSFLKQASKRRGPRKRRRVLHFSTLQATKRKVSSKIGNFRFGRRAGKWSHAPSWFVRLSVLYFLGANFLNESLLTKPFDSNCMFNPCAHTQACFSYANTFNKFVNH